MSISSIMGNSSLLSSILNPSASGSTSTSATGSTSTSSSSQAQALQSFLSALTQALQEGAQANALGSSTASSTAAAAAQPHHHHHGQTSQASQGSTSGTTPNAFQAGQALGSMISVHA